MSNEAKTEAFTPGPWYWSEDPWHGGYGGLYSENGMPVVVPQHENDGDDGAAWFETHGDAGDETLTEANARLIAAAPDLLRALDRIVRLHRAPNESANDVFERVAAWFKDETGYLRPGKSEPMETETDESSHERSRAFSDWISGIVSDARASLTLATKESQ